MLFLFLVKSKMTRQTQSIPLEATMKHEFLQRSAFPLSPVVYTDGCCLGNGTHRAVGGVGVYWAPHHPRYKDLSLTGVILSEI